MKKWMPPVVLSARGRYSFQNASAAAYAAAMTTPPPNSFAKAIDTFFIAYAAAGLLAKTDIGYIRCAHTQQAAGINFKTPGSFTVAPGVIPFTAFRGDVGDGTNTYSTGFNRQTVGALQTQDSVHLAAYCNTNGQNDNALVGIATANVNRITPRGTTDIANARANDTGNIIRASTTDSRGFWMVNRSGAALRQFYLNGTEITNDTRPSVALTTDNYLLLGAVSGATTLGLAFFATGSSLDATEAANQSSIVTALLTSVGAT